MGLGDEIMALGRAERVYEQYGVPVSIRTMTEAPREHDAWIGNPAWHKNAGKKIIDGGGARPYIEKWRSRQCFFNYDYRPRAGRIHLTEEERATCTLEPPYAIVSPHTKDTASVNKNWGAKRWAEVIKDFPVPVYQLCEDDKVQLIPGAIRHNTPSFRHAVAAIENAALVMCNEGGPHHMAASVKVPAVVVFGSFVPPQVTGYEFHYNIAVETEHGYCGKWDHCDVCQESLKKIKPTLVREKALLLLESFYAD